MNTLKIVTTVFVLFSIVTASLSQSSKKVKIGSHVCMTENVNLSVFRNGDPIPEAKTIDEWLKAGEEGKPAWCYYDNDPTNGKKYGKLYNWYAVNDSRQLAPDGWHIPGSPAPHDSQGAAKAVRPCF